MTQSAASQWHSWGVAPDTYYDILGVSPVASPEEIKARYRQLILRIHPDVDGPAALFRLVQKAYEVLSDPVRRASYDRLLLLESRDRLARSLPDPKSRWDRESNDGGRSRGAQSGPYPGPADTSRYGPHIRTANSSPGRGVASVLHLHPAGALATAGAMLLVFGAVLAEVGIALILLGVAALIIAGVAGLGGRGVKEREAFRRSGMTAVDAMTGRQFETLLEHFFANKGYRVARIGGRRGLGADLLVKDAHGRMVVQARRWSKLVNHDAVQHAVAAMAHYGAVRALVVTSSDYSEHAMTVANSNGVILWNRATLAAELISFRGEPTQSGVKRLSAELRAGSCMCLGFLPALIVALVAKGTKDRRLAATKRRR
jgi:restriction system protein